MSENYFLPGLHNQLEFLLNRINLSGISCLVIGTNSTTIAKKIKLESQNEVEIIVEDYESLISSKLQLGNEKDIQIKIMDFEFTDYSEDTFDLIFTQGFISNDRRKKMVKEIKRIIKPGGIFCCGEIVKLEEEIPKFVEDVFDNSNLEPLVNEKLIPYFEDRKWELIDSQDLSFTLKSYYAKINDLLNEKSSQLDESEKAFYKKYLNQISHESNAYLKLGADKYIGFVALLLKNIP